MSEIAASTDSEPSLSVKFRIGSRRTWEPEQEYPRNRKKLGRRTSSVVACLLGGTRTRIGTSRRSESFSERQTYKRLSWRSLDVTVITPQGTTERSVLTADLEIIKTLIPK
ncbi:hypothetical protein JTE90_020108 [Oedothorax gibbosus]|uniref:Uncharacterized protein n=1 Tax=Oedothorax gibbosus TaxID=931172 RepID=A0AAV6VMX6_9ARAC|nr:hypothetical protein JTE90_020108 [Oedothorax gibbosus]